MRYVLLLLSLVTVAACSSKSEREQRPKDRDRNAERLGTSSASETFNGFYNRFSSDSAYQVSRIIFPLQVENYDPFADSITTSTMNAKEWRYTDFSLKEYILKIESEKDTTNVNIRKEGTGVYVDYLFTTINGKWMLVKVVDRST